MKRLEVQSKNTGITPLHLDPEEYQRFNDNIMTAIKKFGSSRKTKAVHKLVQSNIVLPGTFSGEGSEVMVAMVSNQSNLKNIVLNLLHYDDSLAGHGVVATAAEINNFDTLIRKEESFVTEKRLLNIKKLQEQRSEVVDKFIKSLDYIKMVDGIYFGWLLLLARNSIQLGNRSKPKIVTTASEILTSILKKMYSQSSRSKLDNEGHQLIDAISIYFIKLYFYGDSGSYALNDLKLAFSPEIIDAIQRTKITKMDKFSDLANLIKETELMAMTEGVFDSLMVKYFGKYAYEQYIQRSMVDFLAFMSNLAHGTQLFRESFPVDDDIHRRLEELLLNEQKHIVIKKQDK